LILSTKASGKAVHPHPPWKSRAALHLVFCAALALCALPRSFADNPPVIYRVDVAGLGSCYDADASLMLAGHVLAYLAPGALEVFSPHPPEGVKSREEVVLLGDTITDFPAVANRYLVESILGRDVLLAFDARLRSSTGALLAYVYRRADGNCVNFTLIREGMVRIAPPEVAFQFRAEFEMYQEQAVAGQRGIWKDALGAQSCAVSLP